MPPVTHLTFEEFKSYWDFGLSLAGVGAAAIAAWWKFELLKHVFRVAMGQASRDEIENTAQEVNNAGTHTQRALDYVVRYLNRHHHVEAAMRVQEIIPLEVQTNRPAAPTNHPAAVPTNSTRGA